MELLLLTAVAPASGIGRANKLAEVVEQVLGVKKPFYSFGKLGREPLQRSSQKSDTPKFATSRPHRELGNRPRAQTLLFLQKARPELLKMSGGSAYLGGLGRKLCWKNKNGQDFVAGLYISEKVCERSIASYLCFELYIDDCVYGPDLQTISQCLGA